MSSKPTLHLGFAMGGGVSLGTFSGSALTQSIKEIIINKVHWDGGTDDINA